MQPKKKILIVDDDPGIQDVLRLIFDHAGYDTIIYADGNNLLQDNYELPDIFILDKQLSGQNGLDICRHLKTSERSRNIPVIILSASQQSLHLTDEAGADDFQQKPFEMQDLLSKVQKLLLKT